MSPAEAGALIDDTIHPRDITSTIVDLAVRGYIKIEETVDTTLLVFHSKDYIFHLVKPLTEWQGLAPHERVMLENIFAGGQQTRLSSLKNRFYTTIPVIKQDIKAALKNKVCTCSIPIRPTATAWSSPVIVAPFLIAQFSGYKQIFNSVVLLSPAALFSPLSGGCSHARCRQKRCRGAHPITVLGFRSS
jgi:hypothetical protein